MTELVLPQFLLELMRTYRGFNLRCCHSEKADGIVTVKIGERDIQPLDFTLNLEQQFGVCESSCDFEHYSGGSAVHGTMWDESEDDRSIRVMTFEAWVTGRVKALVNRHLKWCIEERQDAQKHNPLEVVSALGSIGDVLRSDRAAYEGVDKKLFAVYEVMALVSECVNAGEETFDHLIEAIPKIPGTMQELSSPWSFFVGFGLPVLSDQQLDRTIPLIKSRLENEALNAIEAYASDQRHFQRFKTRFEQAPQKVGQLLQPLLDAAVENKAPPKGNEIEEKFHRLVTKYNELRRDFAHYRPSSKKPFKDGRRLVDLENKINRFWLEQLKETNGLYIDTFRTKIIGDGRFLSAGSVGYLGWLRVQEEFQMAVDILTSQLADLEMVGLRHASHPQVFEMLINNGLGSFIDSQKPKHIEQGIALIDGIEQVISWSTSEPLYQLACLYARGGRTERALDFVEQAVSHGESIMDMSRDVDLRSIVNEWRFTQLLEQAS